MTKLRFTFGTVVGLMRKQQGLGQHELGVSNFTVSQMELGKQTPNQESMKTIAQHLGTTVEAINAEVDRLNGLSAGDVVVSGDVSGNNNVNGIMVSNCGSVVARNRQDDARSVARHSQESALPGEAAELLRIYKSLDLRGRVKILDLAVSLEEAAEKRKQEQVC